MIKVESNMLILDSSLTKEDANAINEFVQIAKEDERKRIVKILMDYAPHLTTSGLMALIKGEQK